MNPQQTARVAGVLFLITFVTSIPVVLLYDPVLNNVGYVVNGGADERVFVAAFLELLLIVATSAPLSCCSRPSSG